MSVKSARIVAGLVACLWSTAPLRARAEPAREVDDGVLAELVQPRALNRVTFVYPVELLVHDGEDGSPREAMPEGWVRVSYVVGVDGIPKELEIVESLDPVIDAEVLRAVGELRFEAATYRKMPVEIVLRVDVHVEVPRRVEPPSPILQEPEETMSDRDRPPVDPAPVLRVEGTLLTAGDRRPVVGATILAVPGGATELGRVKHRSDVDDEDAVDPEFSARAVADANGKFSFHDLPDGRVRLVILAQGYARLDWVIELKPGARVEAKYYPRPLGVNPYRTEVSSALETMPEITSHSLSLEETNAIPGTQGDAIKAIQNFPGVARAPFGAGQLVIRGAAPGDSAVFLGHHEIPTLYHFGGLTSVFNSDILREIEYIPGNFDARYGDAIGGVVSVSPRRGRSDGYHGYVDSDLFDTGVLFEGPLNPSQRNESKRASFVLSARRSYVDLLLPAVIPDEAGLQMALAPRYWDYQALIDVPLGGGMFSARVFGSDDRARLIFSDKNDIEEDERNAFETVNYFHRADLVYRKVEGPWEILLTPSYRREYASGSGLGEFDFSVTYDTFTARAEVVRRLSKHSRLRVGADLIAENYDFDVTARPWESAEGGGVAEVYSRVARRNQTTPAIYSTLTLGRSQKFLVLPGVRLAYYADPVARTAVDPRVRFSWKIFANTALKGGVGQYSQAPRPEYNDDFFGNPDLGLERAIHTSLSLQQSFSDIAATVEISGFHKRLSSLISFTEDYQVDARGDARPLYFRNVGRGRIYGLEVLVRKNLVQNLFGWVSYTLMRSERQDKPGEPSALFDFDQTHILTLIASYKLPFRWQIGGRFRMVSGSPRTPQTDGVFDASGGEFFPILGPENSDRFPTFHQLDLRIDKSWVRKRVRITAYLDIQNVYNAENVEFYNYAYDYKSYATVNSLPTAPSIGTKIEF